MLRVNLLPQALKPKKVINLDIIFIVFLVIAVLGMAVTFLNLNSKNSKTQAELAKLNAESAEQKKVIESLRAKESTRDLSATQALVAKRKKWHSFIKEMGYIIPPDVWILKMTINTSGDSVGVEFSGLAPSQRAVNRFLSRMERSPSYSTVKLKSSKATADYTPALYAFDFAVDNVFSDGRFLASQGKGK